VALIHPSNLTSIRSFKGPGGLARPQVAAVTEAGDQVSFPGMIQLCVMSRQRAEEMGPMKQILGISQCIQNGHGFEPVGDFLF
jgi:hypothetical protein